MVGYFMNYKNRNGCPIAFSMESFGDKWTLLILREIILFNKKYYDELIAMQEGISTNILADRLKDMERRRFITRIKDAENKRRWIYKPTEKALDLIPMILELAIWSAKYDPYTEVTKKHIRAFTHNRQQTILEMREPFEIIKTKLK